MKDRPYNPNPKGKEGKPITLPPMSFDDALRKMVATELPKHEPKEAKKRATKKTAKR